MKFTIGSLKNLALAAVFSASAAIFVSDSAQADELNAKPVAVVELFTSQGCHSCPPADKVLSNYAKSKDVLALSWHVDYWNYLGWKDTFSKEEFTQRQYLYAASFKRRGVYTPQAVVNGRNHVVGSRGNQVQDLIDTYAANNQGISVPIKLTRAGDTVRVLAEGVEASHDVTMWIVFFDHERQVKIERGENRGKTITYHNVVRDVSMLGMAKQGVVDVTLPLDELKRKGYDASAIILQRAVAGGTPGPIIGATVIDNLQES